jgi:tRNA G18 (ribose-2'-O)-methylase SpoU
VTTERFARHKFLALPVSQQHKKCCELLRRIYEMPWQEDSEDIAHYNDLQQWLGLSSLSFCANRKALADRFHWHLRQTTNGLKEHRLLPTISYLDRPTGTEPLPIAIYLDHIRSAHNVGSIIRTVEAMRLGSLFFSEDMVYADHKQVKDAAMGSETWVECSRGVSLSSLPKPIICLETSSDAMSIYDFIFPAHCTLVVGNEEYGCSDEALTLADHVLQIPMHGRKNSLNVANAFAITAAEIRRQHQFNQIIVR